MEDEVLKGQFDAVVLGTGLVQSILAGALALHGKKVIHIDKNDFYGEYTSSHTLDSFPSTDASPGERAEPSTVPCADNVDTKSFSLPTRSLAGMNVLSVSPNGLGERKKKLQAIKRFPVGAVVDVSPFGLGFVAAHHDNGNAKVLLDWRLADNGNQSFAVMHVPFNRLRKAFPGTKVRTPMGEGKLWSMRKKDNVAVVHLNWRLANGGVAQLFVPQRTLLRSRWLQEVQAESIAAAAAVHGSTANGTSDALNGMILNSHRFCIDLSPYLLLCRGASVNYIVQSNVAQYIEFKSLDKMHLATSVAEGGLKIKAVPCTKSDVFKSSELSLVEKRVLMKFTRFCVDIGTEDVLRKNDRTLGSGRSLTRPQNKRVESYDYEGHREKPFSEFLKNCNVPDGLASTIMYAIGLLPSNCESYNSAVTTEVGMAAIQSHLAALGRFGNTAFLTPLWGAGEMPQAFCRLAAVNGGIYLLRKTPVVMNVALGGQGGTSEMVMMEGEYQTSAEADADASFHSLVLRDGSRIKGENLVMGEDYIPSEFLAPESGDAGPGVARCALVTKTPLASDGCGKAMVVVPPFTNGIGNQRTIYVLQLDDESNVAPKDYYVVHLTTEVARGETKGQAADAVESLKRVVASFYTDDESVLWSSYFTRSSARLRRKGAEVPRGVFFVTEDYSAEAAPTTGEPLSMVCFQSAFNRAKAIFERICPEGEFLKKPEELAEAHAALQRIGGDEDVDSDLEGLEFDESLYMEEGED